MLYFREAEAKQSMIQELDYITLYVRSVKESRNFYTNSVGLQVVHESEHFVLLRAPSGSKLGLHTSRTAPSSGINLHFRVSDVDEIFESLSSRGLSFESSPADQPWGLRSAACKDLDGNTVEFVTPLD